MLRLHPSLLQALGDDLQPVQHTPALGDPVGRLLALDPTSGTLFTNGVFDSDNNEAHSTSAATVPLSPKQHFFSILKPALQHPTPADASAAVLASPSAAISFARMVDAAAQTVHGAVIPTVCWVSGETAPPLMLTEVTVECAFAPCSDLSFVSRLATLVVSYSDDGLAFTPLPADGRITAKPSTVATATLRLGPAGPHRWWRVQYFPTADVQSLYASAGPTGSTTTLSTNSVQQLFQREAAVTALLRFSAIYVRSIALPAWPPAAFAFETSLDGRAAFSFDGRHVFLAPSNVPSGEMQSLARLALPAAAASDKQSSSPTKHKTLAAVAGGAGPGRDFVSSAALVDLFRAPDGFFSGTGLNRIHTIIRRGKQLYVFSPNADVVVCDGFSGQVQEPRTRIAAHHLLRKLSHPLLEHLDGGVPLASPADSRELYLLFGGAFYAVVDFATMALVVPIQTWHANLPGRALVELDSEGSPVHTKLLTASGSDPYLTYDFPFRSVSCVHRITASRRGVGEEVVELLLFAGDRCVRWLVPARPEDWLNHAAARKSRGSLKQPVTPAPTFARCDVLPSPFDGLPITELFATSPYATDPLVVVALPTAATLVVPGQRNVALSASQLAALGDRAPANARCDARHFIFEQLSSSSSSSTDGAKKAAGGKQAPTVSISPHMDLQFDNKVSLCAVEIIAAPVGTVWRLENLHELSGLVLATAESRQECLFCRIVLSSVQESRRWRLVMGASRSAWPAGDTTGQCGVFSVSFLQRRQPRGPAPLPSSPTSGRANNTISDDDAALSSSSYVLRRTPPVALTAVSSSGSSSASPWLPVDGGVKRLITSVAVAAPLQTANSTTGASLYLSAQLECPALPGGVLSPAEAAIPVTWGGSSDATSPSTAVQLQLPKPTLARWFTLQFHHTLPPNTMKSDGEQAALSPPAASPTSATTGAGQFSAAYIPLRTSVLRNISKKIDSYVEAAAAAAVADTNGTGGQLKREDRTYFAQLDYPHETVCRVVATAFTLAHDTCVVGTNFAIFTRSAGSGQWDFRASGVIAAAECATTALLDASFDPLPTPVVGVKFYLDNPKISVRDAQVFEAVMPSVTYTKGLIANPKSATASAPLLSLFTGGAAAGSVLVKDIATAMLLSSSPTKRQQLSSLSGGGAPADQQDEDEQVVSIRIPAHLACTEGLALVGVFDGITVSATLVDHSRRTLYTTEGSDDTGVDSGSQDVTLRVAMPLLTITSLTIAGRIASLSRVIFGPPAATKSGKQVVTLGQHNDLLRATLHYGGRSAEVIHSPFDFPARVGTAIVIESANGLRSALTFSQVLVSSSVGGIAFDVQAFDEAAQFFRSIATVTTNATVFATAESWLGAYTQPRSYRLVCSGLPAAFAAAPAVPHVVLAVSLVPSPVLENSTPYPLFGTCSRITTNGLVNTKLHHTLGGLQRLMAVEPMDTPMIRFGNEAASPDEAFLASASAAADPQQQQTQHQSSGGGGSGPYFIALDLLESGTQDFVGMALLAAGDTPHELLVEYSDDNAHFTAVAVHIQRNTATAAGPSSSSVSTAVPCWCFSSWASHGSHRYWRVSASVVSSAARRRSRRTTSIADMEEGDDTALTGLLQPVQVRGIHNLVWHVAVPSAGGHGSLLPFTAEETAAVVEAQRVPLLALPCHDMLLHRALPIGLPPVDRRRVALPATGRGDSPGQAAALVRAAWGRVSPTLIHAAMAMEKTLNSSLPCIENVLRVVKPEDAAPLLLQRIYGRAGVEKLPLASAKVTMLCHPVTMDPALVVQGWTTDAFLGLATGTQVAISLAMQEAVEPEGASIVMRAMLVAEQTWTSLRTACSAFDAVSRLLPIGAALPEHVLAVHRFPFFGAGAGGGCEVNITDSTSVELFGEGYPSLPAPTFVTKPDMTCPTGSQFIVRCGTTAVFPSVGLSAIRSLLGVQEKEGGDAAAAALGARLYAFLDKGTHGAVRITIHAPPPSDASSSSSNIVMIDITAAAARKFSANGSHGGANGSCAFAGPLRLQLTLDLASASVRNPFARVQLIGPVVFPDFFGPTQQLACTATLAQRNATTGATEMPDVVVCGVAMLDGGGSLDHTILAQSSMSLRTVSGAFYLHLDKATVTHVSFACRAVLSQSLAIVCKLVPAPSEMAAGPRSASVLSPLVCRGYSTQSMTSAHIAEYISSRAAAAAVASPSSRTAWLQLLGDGSSFALQSRGAQWRAMLYPAAAAAAASGSDVASMGNRADFAFAGYAVMNGSQHHVEATFAAYPQLSGYILRIRLAVGPGERLSLLNPGLWFADGTLCVDVGVDCHVAVHGNFKASNVILSPEFDGVSSSDKGDSGSGGGGGFLHLDSYEVFLSSQTDAKFLTVNGIARMPAVMTATATPVPYACRIACQHGAQSGLFHSSLTLVSETDLAGPLERAVLVFVSLKARLAAIALRVDRVTVVGGDDAATCTLPIAAATVHGTCNGCVFEERLPLQGEGPAAHVVGRFVSALANRFAVAFWKSAQI